VAAWYGVIFAFSDQPDLRVSSDDLLDFVLRKAAHMVVFGVLALLCWGAVGAWSRSRAAMLGIGWSLTLALAISDEWHQTFVHGRVGHASDVAIDMTGATLALVAVLLVRRHRRASLPLHPAATEPTP
jgi:VanZ family protein